LQDALPPMQGDRRKIVRLLVTLIEHVLEHGQSDHVEVTVDALDARVRYRVQEAGGRRAAADDETEDAREAAAAAAQLDWALDLVRTVGRLMGGGVTVDAVGDGRTAFLLDLPLDGPPGAIVARG
jgi:signal transduction histidine kinase